MDKSFWGPSTWCSIHAAAISYKSGNVLSYKQFVYSLPHLLPCEYCRQHLDHNLMTIALNDQSLSDNRNLFMWSYFLHDLVNKQLKKRQSPAYQIAEKYYADNVKNNSFWGPCFWRMIHAFAASYRPTTTVKKAFKQFVYSLAGILPCDACRKHYIKNLNQLPLSEEYLQDAHNVFLWSYLLHDLVNKQLGKVSPPFEAIKNQYFNDHVCSSCGT